MPVLIQRSTKPNFEKRGVCSLQMTALYVYKVTSVDFRAISVFYVFTSFVRKEKQYFHAARYFKPGCFSSRSHHFKAVSYSAHLIASFSLSKIYWFQRPRLRFVQLCSDDPAKYPLVLYHQPHHKGYKYLPTVPYFPAPLSSCQISVYFLSFSIPSWTNHYFVPCLKILKTFYR